MTQATIICNKDKEAVIDENNTTAKVVLKPSGVMLTLKLPSDNKIRSAQLALQSNSKASNNTLQPCIKNDISNTWLQININKKAAINQLVIERAKTDKKQGIRIRTLSNGNWLPLTPRDSFEFPKDGTTLTALFPPTATSALMIDFLTEMQAPNPKDPEKTIGTGLLIPGAVQLKDEKDESPALQSTGQACQVSLAIGDEEPFFQHFGVLPNEKVYIPALSRSLNRYLQDNPKETEIPLTFRASNTANITLSDFSLEQQKDPQKTPDDPQKAQAENIQKNAEQLEKVFQNNEESIKQAQKQLKEKDAALRKAKENLNTETPETITAYKKVEQQQQAAATLVKALEKSQTLLTKAQHALNDAKTIAHKTVDEINQANPRWQPVLKNSITAGQGRLCGLEYSAAQAFSLQSRQTLIAIKIQLRPLNLPTSDLQVQLSLHQDQQGLVGDKLKTLTASVTQQQAHWLDFSTPKPLALPAGNYWWVLHSSDEQQGLLWYQGNTKDDDLETQLSSATLAKVAYRNLPSPWQLLPENDKKTQWLRHQIQWAI